MSNKFITIGNTRIKKSNIKNFGIRTSRTNGGGPIGAVIGVISGKGFSNSLSEGLFGKEIKLLYVTTYQNDNFTFSEKQVDLDKALEELESI